MRRGSKIFLAALFFGGSIATLLIVFFFLSKFSKLVPRINHEVFVRQNNVTNECEIGKKVVVISFDAGVPYIFFAPIACYLWIEKVKFDRCIAMFVDKKGELDPIVAEAFDSLRTRHVTLHKLPSDLDGLWGFRNQWLSYNVRIFGCKMAQWLKPCDYVVMSDADMWAFSESYFNDHGFDYGSCMTAINWDSYGTEPPKLMFPMCYIGGYCKYWKQILDGDSVKDSLGEVDQKYITKKILAWPGYKSEPKCMNLRSLKQPYYRLWTNKYKHGSSWNDSQIINEKVTDVHVFRPVSVYLLKMNLRLLKFLGVLDKEEWLRLYCEKVLLKFVELEKEYLAAEGKILAKFTRSEIERDEEKKKRMRKWKNEKKLFEWATKTTNLFDIPDVFEPEIVPPLSTQDWISEIEL